MSFRIFALMVAILVSQVSTATSQEEKQSGCRARLSKKSAMMYDSVNQKRTAEPNFEEIWKEASRDLITANKLGREEATPAAEQALNCLKSSDP